MRNKRIVTFQRIKYYYNSPEYYNPIYRMLKQGEIIKPDDFVSAACNRIGGGWIKVKDLSNKESFIGKPNTFLIHLNFYRRIHKKI